MEKIQGNIEITGTKDDTYYWKVEGSKIKIHINGFSDLHRQFSRCEHCNGAYQSQTILKNHILKYHYRKPKSSKPKIPEPEPEPVASTSKAAAKTEIPRWVKKKKAKAKGKRKVQYEVPNTSDSESEASKGGDSSNGKSDGDSEDDFVGSSRKKFKKLTRNSDYSDEVCQPQSGASPHEKVEIVRSKLDDGLSQNEMKKWLQANASPEGKFKDYAYKTYDMRMTDADGLSIKDFVKEWPLYFKPLCLYDYDFKRKIRKEENLMNVWPNTVEQILRFAGGEGGIKYTLGINIGLRLTQEQKEIATLMILPNIIKNLRARESPEYVCNTESRNVFFRVVPHDQKLAQKYAEKSQKKAPEQPFILLTGKLATMEFYSYNVVLDGHVLKCNTFLDAVDCCFKCYWIFDCEYPIEAEQIWIFLGCIVYNMDDEKRLLPKNVKILNQLLS